MLESLFLNEWPWWGWAIASIPAIILIVLSILLQLRLTRPQRTGTAGVVDYSEACLIANRYIDPDNTMRDGVRIAVRSEILNKYELVTGAKIGEQYNGDLLHRWLQKNAARFLVDNRGKML